MRNVIITGSSGQLGSYFVDFFSGKGDKVFALDKYHLQSDASKNVCQIEIDITDEIQVSEFFGSLSACDILINNAGVGVFTPLEQRTRKEFYDVMNVNLYGTFLMCQKALRLIKNSKSGRIVNIGSIYGVVSSDPKIYGSSGRNNSEVYSATKAGVIQLTKYLAVHFAPFKITVNSLSPGGVFNNQSSDFVGNYEEKVPLGKMAHPQDLISTLDYLVSDNSGYITGQNIIVDGGISVW
ncbi:SDR family oxidoreductase [Gammaproteobacteria bacterium]|nr:SDR family oxidoreductase [Gammaproteobacteria bacterium]